jgi:molybdenum-dependent DNA-binding transcriptional regulator ModE
VAEIVSSSVSELLDWIAHDERTYAQTMEAWTTHCPRLTVWEDALTAGLVEVTRGGRRGSKIVLTPAGSAALRNARAA